MLSPRMPNFELRENFIKEEVIILSEKQINVMTESQLTKARKYFNEQLIGMAGSQIVDAVLKYYDVCEAIKPLDKAHEEWRTEYNARWKRLDDRLKKEADYVRNAKNEEYKYKNEINEQKIRDLENQLKLQKLQKELDDNSDKEG